MTVAPEASATSLAGQAWLADPRLQAVFDALETAGGEARVAGGAVRDALLGKPVREVDIATTLTPQQVIAATTRAGLKAVATGMEHGTVTVVSASDAGPLAVEVTTLRLDVETFGRHARVAFTTDWIEDARRRDFTINALYCDRHGTVFDPLEGMDDLRAGRVRFVGDPAHRIREDYLRILRFFRFSAVHSGGRLDEDGLDACTRLQAGLDKLSRERVRDETLRLLTAPAASQVLRVMQETGILAHVLPGPANIECLSRMAAIDETNGLEPDAILRLAALSLDGIPVDTLREAMVLTNAETRRLAGLADAVRSVHSPHDEPRLRKFLYRQGRQRYVDAIRLRWARSSTTGKSDQVWRSALRLPDRWQPPDLPVSGSDVTALGVPEGPAVGRILRAFEDWWMETGFPDDPSLVHKRLVELAEHEQEPSEAWDPPSPRTPA